MNIKRNCWDINYKTKAKPGLQAWQSQLNYQQTQEDQKDSEFQEEA